MGVAVERADTAHLGAQAAGFEQQRTGVAVGDEVVAGRVGQVDLWLAVLGKPLLGRDTCIGGVRVGAGSAQGPKEAAKVIDVKPTDAVQREGTLIQSIEQVLVEEVAAIGSAVIVEDERESVRQS